MPQMDGHVDRREGAGAAAPLDFAAAQPTLAPHQGE